MRLTSLPVRLRRFRSSLSVSPKSNHVRFLHSSVSCSMNPSMLDELSHPYQDKENFHHSDSHTLAKRGGKVKVVLLEGVHPSAHDIFESKGFEVTSHGIFIQFIFNLLINRITITITLLYFIYSFGDLVIYSFVDLLIHSFVDLVMC